MPHLYGCARLHDPSFTPALVMFTNRPLQTLRMNSSSLFDAVTQDFIVDVARRARNLHLVNKSNTSVNHKCWSALLEAITAPRLALVELGGGIPIQSIIQFLARHREIVSLYIAYPSPPCVSPSMPSISRSKFEHISAPVSCALYILSSTERPSVVKQLHIFPSAGFSSDEEDYFGSFAKCLTKCTAHQLFVEVYEPALFLPGGSNEIWSSAGALSFPEIRSITFFIWCTRAELKDIKVSDRVTHEALSPNDSLLASVLAAYCAPLSSNPETED